MADIMMSQCPMSICVSKSHLGRMLLVWAVGSKRTILFWFIGDFQE